jgi:hypothetical protein
MEEQTMARAIVRISLEGDSGSSHMSAVRKLLQGGGFRKIGTASYESTAPGEDWQAQLHALRQVLIYLEKAKVQLDHLWIYVDEPNPG